MKITEAIGLSYEVRLTVFCWARKRFRTVFRLTGSTAFWTHYRPHVRVKYKNRA